MKKINVIITCIFFSIITSCSKPAKNDSVEQKVDTPAKKEIIKEQPKPIKVVEKPWDSIQPDNVVSFLTTYGAQNKETKVLITTKYGKIALRLYEDTPLHRANFIFLTKIGYFDTTIFYRVTEYFVIQGGNSESLEMSKIRNKYRNYLLPPEFKSNRKHKYGALAAARNYVRNPGKKSSPFEFYIIQGRDGAHHLDNEHTVFGEVIYGYDAIDKIARLETGTDDWPKEDVYMKVEILD